MGLPTYSVAAIPANICDKSDVYLADLSPGVLLTISQKNHRYKYEKVFQQALIFQQMLSDALVVQSDNFEKGLDTTHSFSNVVQARQLLLTVLEPLPEGLPDDPPTQVETTTKTILP